MLIMVDLDGFIYHPASALIKPINEISFVLFSVTPSLSVIL